MAELAGTQSLWQRQEIQEVLFALAGEHKSPRTYLVMLDSTPEVKDSDPEASIPYEGVTSHPNNVSTAASLFIRSPSLSVFTYEDHI